MEGGRGKREGEGEGEGGREREGGRGREGEGEGEGGRGWRETSGHQQRAAVVFGTTWHIALYKALWCLCRNHIYNNLLLLFIVFRYNIQ